MVATAGELDGVAQSVKGNNLPGSTDESYGLSLTQDLMVIMVLHHARLSYRYRGEADLSIFNMERLKIRLTINNGSIG